MKALLSKQDRRQLEFLELLMNHTSLSLSQVKAYTDYPTRTLSSDIRQINAYIKPARVITSSGGVRLEIPSSISARYIYAQILRRSREFKLLIYMFFHEYKKQDDIALEFFLSISTLRRMITTLNKGMKERDIKISSAPYMIVGDETAISTYFFSIFSEIDPQLKEISSSNERKMITALCRKITAEGHFQLNYPRMCRLHIWVYVRLNRIKNDHHIIDSNNDIERFQTEIVKDEMFCREFLQTFKMKLDKQLIFELFFLFLRFGFAKDHEEMECIISCSAPHRALYNKIEDLLECIGKDLEFPLTDTRPLTLELFNILQITERPPKVLYSRCRVFSWGFARENALTAGIIRRHIAAIFDITTDPDETLDLIFYLLVTNWPGLINKLRDSMLKLVVGILFDSDVKHSQFFADLTERLSQRRLQLVFPTPAEGALPASVCTGIDLLITNISNLSVGGSKVICIAAYPTPIDQARISMEIERIYQQKWRQTNSGRQ